MTRWQVLLGDCIEQLAAREFDSVDAVVTDPPYGIRFMGKAWDGEDIEHQVQRRARLGRNTEDGRTSVAFGAASAEGTYDVSLNGNRGYQEWCRLWGEAAFRVLKPGGHLLASCGTRTYHRMVSGIEDAGFEIRDTLAWLYGQGFPKSKNLVGDLAGWGTALKPAHEPIVLARKPLSEPTVEANVRRWGVGALNIEAARIPWQSVDDEAEAKEKNRHADFGSGARENQVFGADTRDRGELGNYDAVGRWPANVLLDEEAARLLDEQSCDLAPGHVPAFAGQSRLWGGSGGGLNGVRRHDQYLDRGGASRFFYVAKATRSERDAGCGDLPLKTAAEITARRPGTAGLDGADGKGNPYAGTTPNEPVANVHPTVKPIALMRHLIRLVTPHGGLVLDPFAGSGTTGCAAVLEGVRFLGIEREPEYVAIANARIAYWAGAPRDEAEREKPGDLPRLKDRRLLDYAEEQA